MNQELKKKIERNDQAKELFSTYKTKEDKIKNMLKTYEQMKKNGASRNELEELKEQIRAEQKQLLASFNQYKEFEKTIGIKKKQIKPVENVKKIVEIKERNKTLEKQNLERKEKSAIKQASEIKVIPIRKMKSTPRKEQVADIIPISKKRTIEKAKTISSMKRIIPKLRKMLIRRPKVTAKKELTSKVIPMNEMKKKAMAKRRLQAKKQMNRNRKITKARRQVARKYRTKSKEKQVKNRGLETIKDMIRRKVETFRKSLGSSKSKDDARRNVEYKKQQINKERVFTTYLFNNLDGHIEKNANKKVENITDKRKEKEEKGLDVIGW